MTSKINTSISNRILDELFATVEVIGLEKTIKSLQDAKTNSLILKDVDIDFFINIISDITGVRRERLLNGNDRNDERKVSTALCIYFLKKELYYSYSDLKKIFQKDEAALYRYFSLVENRPKKPKTTFDKLLDESYKKANLLITEKKIKNG